MVQNRPTSYMPLIKKGEEVADCACRRVDVCYRHPNELVDGDCFEAVLLLHVCIPVSGLATARSVNDKSR